MSLTNIVYLHHPAYTAKVDVMCFQDGMPITVDYIELERKYGLPAVECPSYDQCELSFA